MGHLDNAALLHISCIYYFDFTCVETQVPNKSLPLDLVGTSGCWSSVEEGLSAVLCAVWKPETTVGPV